MRHTSKLLAGRVARATWLLAAAITSPSAPLVAQSSGVVEGSVLSEETRQPLADVVVTVRGTTRAVVTDERGTYRLTGIAVGVRAITAQRLGLAPETRTVHVEAGAPARVDFALAEQANVIAPVIVSATRETQRRADASATIDVIDGAEVRAARAAHPAGILQRVPGVHISQLSGEGHGTAIRQPITTKPLYLYLEDGIPTRSTGFFNHNALYEVNLPQSGGLEVLKGPGTALYGSDAIGGVVNVLTRPAPASPMAEIAAEAGAFGYARLLATGGFTRGSQGIRADLNVTRSDGWRQRAPYERQSATVRWDAVAPGGLAVKTVLTGSNIDQKELTPLSRSDFETRPELNQSPIGYRRVQAARLSSAIERDGGQSLWSVTPYARYSVLELMPTWQLTFDPQVWDTRNTSVGLLAKYRRDFAPLRSRVIVGADVDYSPGSFTADRIAAARTGADRVWSSYAVEERQYDYDVAYRQVAPYLHAELSPTSRLRIDAGVRYDATGFTYDTKLAPLATGNWRRPADTTVTYRRLSPKIGATFDVTPSMNLFASYREGFRAPMQSQLFQQGSNDNTIGLEPVTATSFESGIRGQLGRRVLYTLSAYDMRLHNDILQVIDAEGNRSVSNAGETRHRGIEAGVGAAVTTRLRIDANWSTSRQRYEDWVIPVNGANVSYAGRTIEAAPRTLANVLVTLSPKALGGGRIAAEWSHTGRYYMDPENTHSYRGFGLLSLHANHMIGGSAELFARVVNVLDEKYAELAAYNAFQGEQFTPGTPRSLFAGMRYSWQR